MYGTAPLRGRWQRGPTPPGQCVQAAQDCGEQHKRDRPAVAATRCSRGSRADSERPGRARNGLTGSGARGIVPVAVEALRQSREVSRAMRGRAIMAVRSGRRIWTGRGMAVIAVVGGAMLPAPVVARAQDEPFRDPRLSMSKRIDDLMQRLTLDEKIALLHQYQPAIPRLDIGVFKADTEALHGVAWSNDYNDNGNVVTATATVFPQAVGLASTWDRALVRQIGSGRGAEGPGTPPE